MKLSVVVPCYNEGLVVRETGSRLLDLANRWVSRGLIDDPFVLPDYMDDFESVDLGEH